MSWVPREVDYALKGNLNTYRNAYITILLLHEGTLRQKIEAINTLQQLGYHNILLVESRHSYSLINDVEIRYLVTHEKLDVAALINIGIYEARTPFVLVLTSATIPLHTSGYLRSLIEKEDALCIVPTLIDHKRNPIPSAYVPLIKDGNFRTLQIYASEQGSRTLAPYLYLGIYNREKFLHLEGFDLAFNHAYWQLCDFGMRCGLWGEDVVMYTTYTLQVNQPFATQDESIDFEYQRFYLKNLLPRYNHDKCQLLLRDIFMYLFYFHELSIEAIALFVAIKKWVTKNRYRFTKDAKQFIELWDSKK